MNQWTPQWDTRPPHPTDYRAETPGPYTPPTAPEPAPRNKPPHYVRGTATTVAALAALLIIGLWVSASRDDTEVQIPNTVLHPTSTPTPTVSRFTPQAHKPGPPVSAVEEYMPEDGTYLLDYQVWPGTYSAVCAVEFCSWTRTEYILELGVELGVASSETDPRKRPNVGDTVVVKILKTDSSFITQGFTSWVRS